MSILDRGALEDSPLADLHAIASELSIDGYRRLRRADLIEAILGRQTGEPAAPADAGEAAVADAGEAAVADAGEAAFLPTLVSEPQDDQEGATPRRRR